MAGLALLEDPDPDASVVVACRWACVRLAGVVAGAIVDVAAPVVVVVVGSTMVSSETAVPEWQSTDPPPTAFQVDPVTWMSRVG